MQLVHVARRYGPVGGMERYVWELTNHLHQLGFDVVVLCETNLSNTSNGIQVHELGKVTSRPRWIGYMQFSNLVSLWLKSNPHPQRLVHSHERLKDHQVTTIHGSVFATVLDKPWWKLISLRIWMQLYLEKRELSTASYIVPNSFLMKKQLAHYYPNFAKKLTQPIIPGVETPNAQYTTPKEKRAIAQDAGRIVFVGYEWKRKGLAFAVSIVEHLQKTRPHLEFHVVGPEPIKIKHLFKNWSSGYFLRGKISPPNYHEFDVLLHPASSEPYGMVISEAMAAGIPVVISDFCGAAQSVESASGEVLSLQSSVATWSHALNEQLNRQDTPPNFVRSWEEMTKEYVLIYQDFFNRHPSN